MVNHIVLDLDPTPRNARHGEGGFVTLKNGRIVFAWSRFTSRDPSDFGRADIAGRYSDDGGRTWSDRDDVLVARRSALNVMSASLLRLQDGRIALLYLRKVGLRLCIPLIRFSRDEARTFSPAVPVIREPGYYVVNNDRLVQLRNGRLIVPVAMHRYRAPLAGPGGVPSDFSMAGLIFYCYSDDGGRTWLESRSSYYRCFSDGTGLQEPGVIQLKGGRLWSWTRAGQIDFQARGLRQWESFSGDEGLTWSEPQPTQFISPCSPMQVKRVPSTGDMLAVWNDHSGRFKTPKPTRLSLGRTPLVSAISRDEGRTWKHHRLLEDAPDQEFCYPAIHFTDDAVLLSYIAGGATAKRFGDRRCRLRRISLDDLYA